MAPFSATALPPASPLFRGRQVELARLKQICQEDVTTYTVIYGGHQNGKTSLLLQLEAALRPSAHVCTINFQRIPGATPPQAYAHIGQQITNALPMASASGAISDAPGLTTLLIQILQRSEVRRLVLLLDELGALPTATRIAIAYMLRAWFHERLTVPALAKLQIIFSGGIELYDLVVSEASTLHNICEEIYLADLSAGEAIGLVADGLRAVGFASDYAVVLGQQVNAQVSGHPYLTQRIGAMLAGYAQRGQAIGSTQIEQAVRQISQRGDPLLRQIRNDLREHQLEDAARRLLTAPPRFNRLNDEMVRLELIGLAKPGDTHWQPRNPLLAEVFHEQLGLPPVAPALPRQPISSEPAPTSRRHSFPIWAVPGMLVLLVSVVLFVAWRSIGGVGAALNGTPTTGPSAIQPEPTASSTTAPTDAPTSAPIPPTAGPTDAPTATPTNIPTPEPMPLPAWVPELVKVPAGPFLMGSSDTDTQADDDEKPQHSLELPDYWIGKTEVTNAQFRPFVEGDGYTNQEYWTEAGWQWREENNIVKPEYWDDSNWNSDTQPVVGVSWFEAVAYCRWLSKQTGHEFRLPSEAEWEKAARGPDGLIWPWGNAWDAAKLNSGQPEGKTTPVGQYPDGASPYGALDMAGNAWEWTATKWLKKYPYQLEDEWLGGYLEDGGGSRVFRGGAWYSEQKLVRGACRYLYANPRFRYYGQGLRVASHSPLPGSES